MENPNAILWIKREDGDYKTPVERYTENNHRFISLEFKHGGYFRRRPTMRFTGAKIDIFDFIDVGDLSFRFMEMMMQSIGFRGRPYFYYQHPKEDLEYGVIKMETPADFSRFQFTVWPKFWRATPVIYVEMNSPTISVSYPMTLLDANREKMVKILKPIVSKNPHIQADDAQTLLSKKHGIRIPLHRIDGVMDKTILAVWGQKMETWCLGS